MFINYMECLEHYLLFPDKEKTGKTGNISVLNL